MSSRVMNGAIAVMVGAVLTMSIGSAWAEGEDENGHHHHMPATEPGVAMEAMEPDETPPMDHAMHHDTGQEMNHAGHEVTAGESTAAGLRNPHAWNDGYGFSPLMSHMGHAQAMAGIKVERLERVEEQHDSFTAYELRGWYGNSYERAVIKSEGEADSGRLEEATTQLLWGHAIAPFWDTQLGLRHDSGTAPNRNWLAIGIEGLAPYWFEVGVTAYLGTEGRSAATLTAEYELLLTQRLILQPRIEVNLHGKRDSEWMEGTGLTDAVAGVRLRYEIRREFAPYAGIEWSSLFGRTAEMARNRGIDASEQRLVAGVRFWF